MGRLTSRAVAAPAAVALLAALAGPVAALLVWTAVATPLTATAGRSTTFSFTATNLDLLGELGCLEVVLPGGWTNVTAGGAVPSTGRNDWVASASGTTVVAHSTSGGGRLELGESVVVSITARPSAAGVVTWASHAHQRQDCTGADEPGTPILVTVLPPLLATPTPVATPAATAAPSATPRPAQTPTPTPRPSVTLPPTPAPTSGGGEPTRPPTTAARPSDRALPTATPRASGVPAAEPSPGATPAGGGAAPSAPIGPSPNSPALGPTMVPFDDRGMGIGLGELDLGGVMVWSVPAAALGVPGLLILLWVGLQAGGALAWLPIVRRFRGEEEAPPASS